MQAGLLPLNVELVKGDVYQFSTLQQALGDCNVVLVATGSRPALDPFGPFNIDYQVTFQTRGCESRCRKLCN